LITSRKRKKAVTLISFMATPQPSLNPKFTNL
jgi:hypothetical protein